MFNGHVEIGDGLRLYALSGVHHEEAAFTRRDGATHLVGKVHVSRGVDEVEHIIFAIELVVHLDGVALDGDAALFFQIHIVEHLPFGHFDGRSALKQAVGKGAFAVVDMGDDAEVADMFHVGWTSKTGGERKCPVVTEFGLSCAFGERDATWGES